MTLKIRLTAGTILFAIAAALIVACYSYEAVTSTTPNCADGGGLNEDSIAYADRINKSVDYECVPEP